MTPAEAVGAYMDDLLRRRAEGDELAAVQAEILRTNGQMERVKLMDRQQQLTAVRRRLEEPFVAHAVTWARSENVLRAAFAAEGVPEELLDRAGFPV